jgi:ABC-type transporter Mla subunit MlaD
MATSKKRAAEIQAGVVVVIALVILALGIYWVSGGADQWRAKTTYRVYFGNAGGLKAGAYVEMDGRRVGKVLQVRAANEKERPATILDREYANFSVVDVDVFSDERIPKDSEIEVSKTITGTVTMLIFSGKDPTWATKDTILQGRARLDFDATVDAGYDLVADGRAMIASIEKLIDKAGVQVDAMDIKGLRGELDAVMTKADGFIARLDKLVDEAEEPVLDTLKGAQATVKEYEELGRTVRTDWDEELSPQAGRALRGAGDLVENARPKIDSVLQKLDDAGTLAGETLVTIQDLAGELEGTVAESKPHLVAALRNARAGMQNFKDAAADLKTAPWKLLNKPSNKEVDSIVFYDAAKAYMDAAREVRSSVDDLATLERLGAMEDDKSKEAIARATERLDAASATMQEQEAAIVKALAERR